MIEITSDQRQLEQKLSACFSGGERRKRELRLTQAEARCAAALYPIAVRPLGGTWYEITFQGVNDDAS